MHTLCTRTNTALRRWTRRRSCSRKHCRNSPNRWPATSTKVWAQTRIVQGWSYGPERDDATKKHPCLIPYEELPEAEREYDRNTAVETIRLILKLGFKIEPK